MQKINRNPTGFPRKIPTKILVTPNPKTANIGNTGKYSINEGFLGVNEVDVGGFVKPFKPKLNTIAARTEIK
ncbi:hypothetical protein ACL6C3_09740 [Capilliphycus salinus ALCB114379]|uniref:hypothetical protein n=1 Tax=Capilliphycus salinus TaxID=2768948 RepID=UPI0039A4B128